MTETVQNVALVPEYGSGSPVAEKMDRGERLWSAGAALCLVAGAAALAGAAEVDKEDRPTPAPTATSKGGHKELEQMYMMVMMAKALLSMLFIWVSPVLEIKGFFLSLINTLINVARFFFKFKHYLGPGAGLGGGAAVTGLNYAYKRVSHFPQRH